jgi:type I restriction enzyme S subunit
MSEWRWTTIGQVTNNFDRLRRPVRSSDRVSGDVPYYGASGIVDWVEGHTHEGTFLLVAEDGENLRSRSVPVAFIARGKSWVNNHAHVLTGNELSDTRYLEYVFATTDLTGYLTGSAQPKLSRAALDAIPVLLPSVATQRAVAEVLGALDDKIAANTRTVDAARHLIRARVSVAGTSCALRDVAILNKSSVNPQSMSAPTVAHFSLPAFDEGAWPEIVVPSQIKSNKFMVPGPAVLLSKLNPRIPRVWDVVGPPENSLASTEFLVLTSEVPSTALWGAISQPATQVELASKVAGTSGSHQRVRPEEVMDLRIPDPRSLSQNVLAAIDGLGRCVWSLQAESQSLVRTRDELLPLLMSGKVRVKDAEKAVEEVV